MRAGSLSHDDVTARLRKHTVTAWTNTEGEVAAGGSFAHGPDDSAPSCIRGNGEHNVQILFVTPVGEIFHTLSGYLSAEDLVEELDFGLELFRTMLDAERGERAAVLTGAHRRKLIELEGREFDGPLAEWAKRRALADHRFAAAHPLLHVDDFRTEMLVGNARSFFGSARGAVPEARIGEVEEDAGGETPPRPRVTTPRR